LVADWLLDETRQYGDVTTIETDLGIDILLFVSRDDNNYHTVGMRQILILREQIDPEDFPLHETDQMYIQALEEAANEAHERAELVNSLFLAAGATEDALINLMDEHSDDTTPGGYYSNISKFPYQSSHLNTSQKDTKVQADR